MVKHRGEGSEKEVWLFITHVVREIGRELHKVRNSGVRSDAVGQVWYALQAYTLQEEIIAADIHQHDIVTNVFHKFIRDKAVSKHVFERRLKAAEDLTSALRSEVEQVKKECQRLKSQKKEI